MNGKQKRKRKEKEKKGKEKEGRRRPKIFCFKIVIIAADLVNLTSNCDKKYPYMVLSCFTR
jgi:hypothetical protein